MTSSTDAAGKTTSFAYDFARRIRRVTYADGSTKEIDPKDVAGLVDPRSGLGSEAFPAPLPRPRDAVARIRDELDRETTIELDDFGLITAVVDPLGIRREYERDEHGRVVRMVQPRGDGQNPDEWAITTFAYDSRGNVTLVTLPDGATRSFEYDATFSQVTRAVDELGRETLFTLDSHGNVLSAIVVLGARDSQSQETDDLTTALTYTALGTLPGGLVTSVTDPRGFQTTLGYGTTGGGRGRVVAATYAVGTADEAAESFEYTTYRMLAAHVDGLGRRTDFTYDNLDRRTSVTGADPDGGGPLSRPVHAYAVTAFGLVTSETDALGRVAAYEYDARHRLKKVTLADPDGAGPLASPVNTTTRDAAQQVTAVTDPLGRVTTYEYDLAGRMVAATLPDPDGAGGLASPVYRYEYDAAGLLLAEIDPLLHAARYEYDKRGRLVKATAADPDGAGPLAAPVTVYVYDAAGQLTNVTDPLSRATALEYDDAGRLIEVTLPDPDGAGPLSSPVTFYGYDKNGNTIGVLDPLLNATIYVYDARNRPTSVTEADPDGAGPLSSPVTAYAYDDASQVTGVTDALGRATTFAYDNLGRLLATTLPDPDGAGPLAAPVYANVYDAVGNLTAETDPLLNATAYAYDNLGRLKTVTEADPDGAGSLTSPVTSYAYDAASQLTGVTDPLSRVTSFGYDNLGRRKTVTLPDPDGGGAQTSPVYSYAYDAASSLTSETDPLGNVTAYTYDHLHRVTKLTEPDPDGAGGATSPETLFAYDAVGNRTSLTDPVGNETTWVYDGLDRVLTETNELGKTRSFVYDAASNLTKKTDRNGRVTEFTYDSLHRQTAELWKDGQTTLRTLSYSYDAASQVTGAGDPATTLTYAYDALGRATTIASDAPALDVELTQGFDAAGRRTLLGAEVNSAGDLQDRFFYDNLGRVTKIERDSAPEFRVDFAYDAAGQFTSIKRYKDLDGGAANLVVETTYAYDGIGRLTDLTHFKDATTFADYGWTYDAFSRVTQFSFSHLVGGSGSSAYTYDRTSQVTGADHTNQTDETYTYDSSGNRTISGYTTGANNRLTSDGTFTFTYDDEGNRVTRTHTASGQVDEYAYDHRNRMTGVTTRATSGGAILQTVAYTYDVWDRRIEKIVDADGAGSGVAVITRWAYDGQNVLLTVDATGLVTHRYLYGPDGQVLADDYIGAEKYFPLADNLGSIRDILDHTGAVRNHIDYNAFGRVTNETTAAFDFLFGYTGFERNEETGLLHSDTRYYDAVHARWTQEDWDVFHGGDQNLSRYVSNNPTNFIDPDGRQELSAAEQEAIRGGHRREQRQRGGSDAAISLDERTRNDHNVGVLSQRQSSSQYVQGQIHATVFLIILYEDVPILLAEIAVEVATAGVGGRMCKVVEHVPVKYWFQFWKSRKILVEVGEQTWDITTLFNKLKKAHPTMPDADIMADIEKSLRRGVRAQKGLVIGTGKRVFKPGELESGRRVAEKWKITLFEHVDDSAEFIDGLGNTYDVVGRPGAARHFGDGKEFLDAVDFHLKMKCNDFTIIDLTDFTAPQAKIVAEHIAGMSKELQGKIIRIGFKP